MSMAKHFTDTRSLYLSIVISHGIIVILYLEMSLKNVCEVNYFSFSHSAVSAHAPSFSLQEIRKEKRLTAQFHKTPPRYHFIFSQTFFSLFISLLFFENRQSDNSGHFLGNLSLLPWRRTLLSPSTALTL